MRLGIACDGAVPAAVLEVLGRAGCSVAGLERLRPPAYREQDGQGWLLATGEDVLAALLAGGLAAALLDKETLLERRPQAVELLDLGVGRDRLVLAAAAPVSSRPRVATRLPCLAARACAAQGWQARVLRFGAPVLAVRLGLAEALLERASVLAAEIEGATLPWSLPVADVSVRLVTTAAARALWGDGLARLVADMREAVVAEGAEP